MPQIATPTRPLTILTPAARLDALPDPSTLQLIADRAQEIIASDERYSVTYSPLLAPAGKNFLFSLHPHYWKLPSGIWGIDEHRDGERNPYSEIPQGQKQLQSFSMAIRDLALAVQYLPERADAATNRAQELIHTFLLDPDTRMRPEVLYSQCVPGETPIKGNTLFIFPCRFLVLISQNLARLKLDPSVESQAKEWIRQHVQWMRYSEQGVDCMMRDDNKPAWLRAVIATHLRLVNPPQAVELAKSFFAQIMADHPAPAEFFKRSKTRTRVRHSVLFLLEPTFLLAEVSTEPGDEVPPADVLVYLTVLVEFARTVQPADAEAVAENDERFLARLALFEKILARWKGESAAADAIALDGSGWDGGWDEWMKLSWGLV